MPDNQPSRPPLPPPFLAGLSAGPYLFDLGGKLTPGSIRDQVIRARLLTDLLYLHGFIAGGKEKTICVIGAGAAGVTISMRIVRLGNTHVWLAEKNAEPLSILANGAHRLISPTVYDWPAAHCSSIAYAPEPTYNEDLADVVRQKWVTEFIRFKEAYRDSFTWMNETEAEPLIELGGPPWRVNFTSEEAPSERDRPPDGGFDILVLTRGFGRERSIPRIEGGELNPYAFWDSDPYPRAGGPPLPDWGRPKWPHNCAVVIAGGGDGAIQDTLRFVTGGGNARDILIKIKRHLPDPSDERLMSLLGHIDNADRYAALEKPSLLLNELHSGIRSLADQILTPDLCDKLAGLVKLYSICVLFPDSLLGPCYPLNLFLTYLFRGYIRKVYDWDILQPKHSVERIECLHAPDKDGLHYNLPHKLRYRSPNGSGDIACQVVVPRIGIDEKSVPCERQHFRLHHVLPYWLPDWKPQ